MTLGRSSDPLGSVAISLLGFLILTVGLSFVTGSVTVDDFDPNYMTGLPTSGDYNEIAVADIDGDSDPDLAFGGEDFMGAPSTGIYVYAGNGAGTWSSASSGLPTVDSWGGLAMGDADNDGNIEIYGAKEGWGSSSGSVKGLGAWEYYSGSWSQTGISSPWTTGTTDDVVLSDLNGDLSLDLAVTSSCDPSSGIRVFTGSGSSPISWTSFSAGLPTTGECTGICAYDMNNDGLQDILSGSYSNAGVGFYVQGSTGWTKITSSAIPSSGFYFGVAMGDIDNDGNGDMIIGTSGIGIRVLLGNGGGSDGKTFSWTDVTSNLPVSARGYNIYQLSLSDIDLDGDLDLLLPQDGGGLHLYLGNGTEASGTSFRFNEFSGPGLPASGTYYGSAFLDFDMDGVLDVAGASYGNGIQVYKTNFTMDDPNNKPPVPVISGGGEVILGKTMDLTGNLSHDPEDCPLGDIMGSLLKYDWNLTKKPANSLLNENSFKPSATKAFVNLTPDVEGTYDITLALRDSHWKRSNKGMEAKATINCINNAPIPDAEDNVTVLVNERATLNGSESIDPDGHAFEYEWNFTVYPPGSKIRDSYLKPNDKAPKPYFKPDLPGRYEITLALKDSYGKWSSKEDKVTVHSEEPNDPPVALAGPDQSVHVWDHVTLDGSGSYDPDGMIVEVNWTCKNRIVTLFNGTTERPSFVPNETGLYTFTLRVRDSNDTWSDPDLVRITAVSSGSNLPPIASAGADFSVIQGDIAILDGSESYDPDGSIMAWEWTTDIEINDSATGQPWFTTTTPGNWTFSLRVMDNKQTWSEPDEVIVTVRERHVNEPPHANAGPDQTVNEGSQFILNGSSSSDPDGCITKYKWKCIGQIFSLDEKAVISHSIEDPGLYTFSLVVTDDEGAESVPDLVNITVKELTPLPVMNVTPIIGPLMTDLGNVVAGATVRLTSGSLSFSAITDAQGKARFSQGIPPGNYTMIVVKGADVLLNEIKVRIRTDGNVEYKGGSLPKISEYEKGSSGGGSIWIFALAALAAILMLVIVSMAIFLMRKKPESQIGDKCPKCNIEMVLKDESGKFYCALCKVPNAEESIPSAEHGDRPESNTTSVQSVGAVPIAVPTKTPEPIQTPIGSDPIEGGQRPT